MSEIEHRVRETLIEGIVVGDDALMERYLDGEVPSVATSRRHSQKVSLPRPSSLSCAARRLAAWAWTDSRL